MKKSIANNIKIKYILLSILFSILFIFTALSNPIEAHAYEPVDVDGTGRADVSIPYVINLNMYESNEEDESTNDTAGYLSYAASGDRCGVMFYVIDDRAQIRAIGVLLDEKGMDEYGRYHMFATDSELDDAIGAQRVSGVSHPLRTEGGVQYVPNVSPVAYSGGWTSTGSDVMAYLTSDSGYDIEIEGVSMPCPVWALYVAQVPGGSDALKRLAEPETKWQVIVEPVSVNYLYTEDTFPTDRGSIDNVVDGPKHQSFEAGSPVPVGSWQGDSYKPTVYIGTARNLLKKSNNIAPGGSQYTYKFYNKQFPYSMCLSNDIEVPRYAGGMASGTRTISGVSLSGSIPRLTSSISTDEGIGLASIEISGFSLPPIHTFGGTTPGDTEVPKEENGTTGECTIKKLYYTEVLNPDGTLYETKDFVYYTRTGTTEYISIDEEEGYEIEGWKATNSNKSCQSLSDWNAISSANSGTSSGIQSITTDYGAKYLYILYKKVVVLDEEPSEYDFELQESQITKRVTFLESSTTSQLLTHSFSWTSPAHSPTACASHGGKGHRLNCSTVWDVVPVTGVAHTHTDSCSQACSTDHEHTSSCPQACSIVWDTAPVTGVAHTHTNSCYDTPCSTFAFTDSQVKLGIKLDNTTLNKAVVSKNWGITYDDTETNVVVDDAYYGEFTRTSPDANTISKSNYNAILLLFRGNDKLTLADWKNTSATTGYLTNIALDPAYNFKSANTPQGSRRAGDEYQETTSTKFINRSPDTSTTYKATVGTHGTCGSTKQYTFTNNSGTSSAYTIDNITVNIKVFWANGVSPSTRGTISNNLVAGSASFYPYIRMRYDNNTQNDKKVYVLGQRNRSATFYDYASVSISSSGDPLLSINSNQYYLR